MDIKKIKKDFPILVQKQNENDLVYLDSAATAQKPQVVIDSLIEFYTKYCSNVHRGVSDLAEKATSAYNSARQKVASFIGAKPEETIFVRGATAGVNFIADAWGRKNINQDDEIIISIMEHHSNILPWQQLVKVTGAKLKFIKLTDDYQFDLDQYKSLLSNKTKLVSIMHSSNVLGVVNNLDFIINEAKKVGAAVFVDAVQSVPYIKVDVKEINCDFLVLSGHKMMAPDGIGALYIDSKWLDRIEPYQSGSGVVSSVGRDKSIFLKSPEKFESGTMPIAGAIALGAAVDYYNQNLPWNELEKHLANLCENLIDGFEGIPQVKIIGDKDLLRKSGHLVSFVVDGFHAHDVAAYLNQFGICVRAGNHCAQLLHDYLNIPATVRVSFHVYNTEIDVENVIASIKKLISEGL